MNEMDSFLFLHIPLWSAFVQDLLCQKWRGGKQSMCTDLLLYKNAAIGGKHRHEEDMGLTSNWNNYNESRRVG